MPPSEKMTERERDRLKGWMWGISFLGGIVGLVLMIESNGVNGAFFVGVLMLIQFIVLLVISFMWKMAGSMDNMINGRGRAP